MIRYNISPDDLRQRIEAINPTWLTRAAERTRTYARSRDYTGGSEFWGQIKQVYIDLQHEKCAYCEMKMGGSVLARKVHEVEHFRPKSQVSAWPTPKQTYQPDFFVGRASDTGYYKLAYHPLNYAISCTRCNSTLKSDYFPIRGRRRRTALADPAQAQSEDALLIYPISDLDADPETLITFHGVLAVPRQAQGPDHQRARVTIEFFQLNHEDLTMRRARQLYGLFGALEAANDPGARASTRRTNADIVDTACDPTNQFSACMKAFRDLYLRDRPRAERFAALARQLIPDAETIEE